MLAIKLSPDEHLRMEPIHSDQRSLLDFCYGAIGCSCIEIVHPRRLPDPYVMIVDESGMLKGLPVNALGSVLYETDRHGWPILGTALLMKQAMTMEGPDIVSLDEDDVEALRGIMNNAIRRWDVEEVSL